MSKKLGTNSATPSAALDSSRKESSRKVKKGLAAKKSKSKAKGALAAIEEEVPSPEDDASAAVEPEVSEIVAVKVTPEAPPAVEAEAASEAAALAAEATEVAVAPTAKVVRAATVAADAAEVAAAGAAEAEGAGAAETTAAEAPPAVEATAVAEAAAPAAEAMEVVADPAAEVVSVASEAADVAEAAGAGAAEATAAEAPPTFAAVAVAEAVAPAAEATEVAVNPSAEVVPVASEAADAGEAASVDASEAVAAMVAADAVETALGDAPDEVAAEAATEAPAEATAEAIAKAAANVAAVAVEAPVKYAAGEAVAERATESAGVAVEAALEEAPGEAEGELAEDKPGEAVGEAAAEAAGEAAMAAPEVASGPLAHERRITLLAQHGHASLQGVRTPQGPTPRAAPRMHPSQPGQHPPVVLAASAQPYPQRQPQGESRDDMGATAASMPDAPSAAPPASATPAMSDEAPEPSDDAPKLANKLRRPSLWRKVQSWRAKTKMINMFRPKKTSEALREQWREDQQDDLQELEAAATRNVDKLHARKEEAEAAKQKQSRKANNEGVAAKPGGDIKLGKGLKDLLRHKAKGAGYSIDHDGWVTMQEAMRWLKQLADETGDANYGRYTSEDVRREVELNPKKRFELSHPLEVIPLGCKWRSVGSKKPAGGTELTSKELKDALQRKLEEKPKQGSKVEPEEHAAWLRERLEFKPSEVDGFKIKDALRMDSYVKVGDEFVQQAAGIVLSFGDKGRPAASIERIRAAQGHTMKGVRSKVGEQLTNDNAPDVAVHGSYSAHLDAILKGGLNRMNRQHIHLAKGLLGEENVISGMRANSELYIWVYVQRAISDGYVFYESANGERSHRGSGGHSCPRSRCSARLHHLWQLRSSRRPTLCHRSPPALAIAHLHTLVIARAAPLSRLQA